MDQLTEAEVDALEDEAVDLTNKSPATPGQLDYITMLLDRLRAEADWSHLSAEAARLLIVQLNSIRKRAGVPFVPMAGFDSDRYSA